MTAGIPNEALYFGFPLAGLTALIPFYLALSKCRNFREAGLSTSLLAGCIHITSSFWLANFKEYAIFTIGASSAFYFLTGWFAGQVLFVPFSLSGRKDRELEEKAGLHPYALSGRILFFAGMITILEWLKSNGFLAYPWGTLILTAWKWKLFTQIVALTGTWGISFMFSLFAATAAEGIIRPSFRKHAPDEGHSPFKTPYACAAFFTASLFALSLIYGTAEYTRQRTPVKTLNTVLVQHNGDSWEDSEEECLATAERLTAKAIAESALEPDLAVWSEGVLTYPLPDSWWYYDLIPSDLSLRQSIADADIPFIIGAPYVMNEQKTEFGNCAVLFDRNADIADYYAKIHLVPFAEGIPFGDKLWMKKFMQLLAGFSQGWKAGEEYKTFPITAADGQIVDISAPVCFEDAFPDVCRNLFLSGSEVFMNLTNDSWSLKKSSEYQHYVMASYRALECRTTLVRVTNGGFTSVTDPAGRILTCLPLFEQASILAEIPVYERQITPYAMLGDWVPLLAAIMVLAITLQFLHSQHTLQNVNSCDSDD